jgi:hypothetical protein
MNFVALGETLKLGLNFFKKVIYIYIFKNYSSRFLGCKITN